MRMYYLFLGFCNFWYILCFLPTKGVNLFVKWVILFFLKGFKLKKKRTPNKYKSSEKHDSLERIFEQYFWVCVVIIFFFFQFSRTVFLLFPFSVALFSKTIYLLHAYFIPLLLEKYKLIYKNNKGSYPEWANFIIQNV